MTYRKTFLLLTALLLVGCSKEPDNDDIMVLTLYVNKTYQEMYLELGTPVDKTSYTIAQAPTKAWNHQELFSQYPKIDKNKHVQIFEAAWELGNYQIRACFHTVEGEHRCLVAKRIKKGVQF